MVEIYLVLPVYCAHWNYSGSTSSTRSTRSTSTRSTNQTKHLKYASSPPESNLLQLPFVGPFVHSECCLQKNADELSKRRCTYRWSEYTSYSQYTALIEEVWYYSEYSQYSQYQYSQIPGIRIFVFMVTCNEPVLAITTGRNTAGTWQYPQYGSLKYYSNRV